MRQTLARFVVRVSPRFVDAIVRERAALERVKRKEQIHVLATRADRRVRPYGKQSAPGTYGKEDA